MPRPPRIPVPGAYYHVYTRGNRQGAIVADEDDAAEFLRIGGDVVRRLEWRCIAYCLMTNHYHLLIQTPRDDLSAGMQALNGRYARAFNRRHACSGHVFERRFGCVVAESQWHLLWLCRYVVLNPVRAGLCRHPAHWKWSSYRASAGRSACGPGLDVHRLLALFGSDPERARAVYRMFVENGIDSEAAA